MSQVAAAEAAWKALFRGPRKIVVISCSKDKAQEFLRYVKYYIPAEELTEDNKGYITLKNGSRIITQASGENSARSIDARDLILDEFAYVKYGRDYSLWKSAQPAVSTGGSITVLSTPDGPAGKFYDLWEDASGANIGAWKTFELPWNVNPEWDAEWAKKAQAELTVAEWAEAYDCDFARSGDTYWSIDHLKACYQAGGISSPRPEEGHQYLLTADMAGYGKDLTVLLITDRTQKPYRIVASEKFSKVDNDTKYEAFERLSRVYGVRDVYLDASGQSAVDVAEEIRKYFTVHEDPDQPLKRNVHNFKFLEASKKEALTRLTRWVEHQDILFDTPDLFREARQYKIPDTNLQTDHVMALAIAAHVLEKPSTPWAFTRLG